MMKPQELAKLNDDQLIELAKQSKPSPLFDAFFLGSLVGILIFGFVTNGWFWLAVLPLFLIHQILRKPKKFQALQAELIKRGIEVPKT